MERHGSCSAWDEDHETDDVMAEVLTRSASAAQREARAPPQIQLSNQPKPQPPLPRRERAPSACVLAGRPASSGYATDRILVLREQLRRLEVELASAHEALRQAKTRSCKTLIGRGEGSCARLARDATAAASCGCRPATRSTTSSSSRDGKGLRGLVAACRGHVHNKKNMIRSTHSVRLSARRHSVSIYNHACLTRRHL